MLIWERILRHNVNQFRQYYQLCAFVIVDKPFFYVYLILKRRLKPWNSNKWNFPIFKIKKYGYNENS
jgi:hypothetical protein